MKRRRPVAGSAEGQNAKRSACDMVIRHIYGVFCPLQRPLHHPRVLLFTAASLHHASAEKLHCLSTAFQKTKNPSAGLIGPAQAGAGQPPGSHLLPHQAPAAVLSWWGSPSRADTAFTLVSELLPLPKALSFSPSITSSASQITSVQGSAQTSLTPQTPGPHMLTPP